jgi:hypothetical protein
MSALLAGGRLDVFSGEAARDAPIALLPISARAS